MTPNATFHFYKFKNFWMKNNYDQINGAFSHILQRSQAVLAGTLHIDHYPPTVSFQCSGFLLGWLALKADKMIKGYEGFYPNQTFLYVGFIALQRKTSNDSFFRGVNKNEHEFQNGGFLTFASYLIKESISISMEFKETLHKRGDRFSVLIKMIENKLLGLVASTLKTL